MRAPLALFVLGPFVAFFATGYFSGFGAVTAEIYPTAIRAHRAGLHLQHRPSRQRGGAVRRRFARADARVPRRAAADVCGIRPCRADVDLDPGNEGAEARLSTSIFSVGESVRRQMRREFAVVVEAKNHVEG